jgi:hypothetical protein
MRARLPGCSPLSPPTPAGSPTVPAGVYLVVPRTWPQGAPETVAVHLSSPRPSSGWPRRRRASGRRRWGPSGAWNRPRCWPSTPCPTPTPRCGGSGSRSMSPTSRRCGSESSAPPCCWPCGACPCCGASANQRWLTCASSASRSAWARRSHAAGACGAPSNASWVSAWRIGCCATSSACAPMWRRSAAASSPGCSGAPARSTTGWWACTSTGSPSPAWLVRTSTSEPLYVATPAALRGAGVHTDRTLGPPRSVPRDRPPRPPPVPPPRHHPRPRPPTMTVPPVPRRRPAVVPRGSPTVVPHRQTQRAHPCRCPCGAPAGRPPSAPQPPRRA